MITNLKKLRMNLGLSQREVAERSGILLNTYQKYEQGKRDLKNAKYFTIIRLSQTLCCDVLDLFD